MPIKEIIAFGMGVLSILFAANPLHFREATRRIEIQIMHEVGRTENWGNPSIFKARASKQAPEKR